MDEPQYHGLSRTEIRSLPSSKSFILLDRALQDYESWQHLSNRIELENSVFDATINVLIEARLLISRKCAADPILAATVRRHQYRDRNCAIAAALVLLLGLVEVWRPDPVFQSTGTAKSVHLHHAVGSKKKKS